MAMAVAVSALSQNNRLAKLETLQNHLSSSLAALTPLHETLTTRPNSIVPSPATHGLSLLALRPSLLLTYTHLLLSVIASSLSPSAVASTDLPLFSSLADLAQPGDDDASLWCSLLLSLDLLHRSKTMETKVETQVDRLIKVGEEIEGGKEELNFRPDVNALSRPGSEVVEKASGSRSNLSSSRKGKGVSANEVEQDEATGAVYRPPRVMAVPYDEGGKKGPLASHELGIPYDRLIRFPHRPKVSIIPPGILLDAILCLQYFKPYRCHDFWPLISFSSGWYRCPTISRSATSHLRGGELHSTRPA